MSVVKRKSLKRKRVLSDKEFLAGAQRSATRHRNKTRQQ